MEEVVESLWSREEDSWSLSWRVRSPEGPSHAVPEESRPWVSAEIPVANLVMGPTKQSALKDVNSCHECP